MRKSTRSERPAAPVSSAAPASTDPKRRRFLLALGASGAGAAAAGVAAMPAGAAPAPADNDQDGRYSETRQVRDYYRTAKL
jgi:hypothetical protein